MSDNTAYPKSILITGASSGIGAALARGYAAPGVFLALGGRDRDRLNTIAGACRERGAEAQIAIPDVTDPFAMKAWIDAVDADHPLDLIIANAGISGGPGGGGGGNNIHGGGGGNNIVGDDDGDNEDGKLTRDLFATNVNGVINTVLPALPHMKVRSHGQIAIMGSLAGCRGMPGAPAYSASKAAVMAWGEALRGSLAPDGIAVTIICPGFVESGITARNTFHMPFLMKADKAAAIIRRRLARNPRIIAFPWIMYRMAWLMAALPRALTDPLFSRLPKKD